MLKARSLGCWSSLVLVLACGTPSETSSTAATAGTDPNASQNVPAVSSSGASSPVAQPGAGGMPAGNPPPGPGLQPTLLDPGPNPPANVPGNDSAGAAGMPMNAVPIGGGGEMNAAAGGALGGDGASGGEPASGGTPAAGGTPVVAGAGGSVQPNQPIGDGAVWPNDESQANSDSWLWENHDRITRLEPRVLIINLESSTSMQQAQDRIVQHVRALEAASSFHGYEDPDAEPALSYQPLKIVNAEKGSRIDYNSWNTQQFADDVIQIAHPDDPGGRNLTLCELFEQGVINEVWCMASQNPKCGETQEAKQVWNADGTKSDRIVHVSNGDNITSLGCEVTARITDFNSGRGAGCHLHAMGHAWERYMDSNAVPMLRKQAARFLNWDLDTRVGAPFSSFYSACSSNGTQLTDCMIWESEISMRSGPSASRDFDIADMSEGCGNAHFYPNTTGTYSYDAAQPDPTVLTSCENYGMHNGPDGKDLTTEYSNAMTDQFYGRSQRTCAEDQPSCDDDCGGHGTTYLYQNFPGPGTTATNDDQTPMQNWWVYLFY